uniref:Uncharacterized protein n=1 Tax=Rhizophora mucronata TaxID=61149 RepID=A0A2P2P1J6_RHIMU
MHLPMKISNFDLDTTSIQEYRSTSLLSTHCRINGSSIVIRVFNVSKI